MERVQKLANGDADLAIINIKGTATLLTIKKDVETEVAKTPEDQAIVDQINRIRQCVIQESQILVDMLDNRIKEM